MKPALVALVSVIALWAGTAYAAGPAPAEPSAVVTPFGDLTLVSLKDADFAIPNDAKTFGVDVGAEAVATVLKAAGQPIDHISVSIGSLMVKGPGEIVLLDTGVGGVLQASLAKAGVAPDQVTDILITHTHGDHVGGLRKPDGTLAFPKAVIHMSANEWASIQGQATSKALVEAIAPRIKTFAPGDIVVAHIQAIAIDGHTPGHVGYEITSGKLRLMDIGDTAHSSLISLAKPGWTMGFDRDAALGKASREATLARLAKTREWVYAPHFPFPSVGHIVTSGGAFAWAPKP